MKNAKKVIAVLLCIASLFSLVACSNNGGDAETTEVIETTEAKDYSQWAGLVDDPTGWLEAYNSLPIANESMSVEELRQLCVDAFKADLTFQWTPNKDISYSYVVGGNTKEVALSDGIAYSGLCYATGVVGATTGNIHKILKYYDTETGVLDVEAMGDKFMGIITSACSFGALQGWNRVINSHTLETMSTYNASQGKIVPVGPYTYTTATYNYDFSTSDATTKIIFSNDYDTMYESYANMLPADGLYSSPGWHVMMCSSVPVVVKDKKGKIDPDKSYLLVCEQDQVGTTGRTQPVPQSNGTPITPLGTVDNKYTFAQLAMYGYIPFTFMEFLGTDPVEPGKAWMGNEFEPIANGMTMSLSALAGKEIAANYVINTAHIEVKNADGKVLYTRDLEVTTGPFNNSIYLSNILNMEKLTSYANGTNTIHIMVQLANGELLDAYNTILPAE